MDIIGIAETGSGKTLAFGLPAVAHIVSQHPKSKKHDKKARGSQITVLVISPTRELALQTHETLTQIGALVGIQSVCVFGGVGKDEQRRVLAQPSTKVLVGTPGRLLDLASEGACDLGCVTYLVLDEADRMLDKGFENDIRRIIEQTADMSQRQTLMFSATWPKSVQNLAATFLKSPVRITIGSEELAANSRVKQAVEVLDDPKLKSQRLRKLLKDLNHPLQSTSEKESRILVFVLYKKEADRVLETVQHWGYSAGGIHGDINQNQRMKALEDFKTGRTGLLVATDVAARGLDIPNVSSVINYSFPLTVEDYVHRIGRTGRGGKHGESYTFFTGDNHERALAGEFAAVLRNAGADPSELQARFPMAIKKREHSAYGAFYRDDIKMPNKPTKLKF
ncbi:uncharacterized protein EI90DRAFT_2991491 [Cantharellus anzutake]|uniref:uncharacterized protein n=1 Tax=Cantharellus anzutake TaxID=1750568 RepID=UPI001906FAED|nr:uncharacterized protein EI90DRAFT_2991491 [Cantharellus anzutake]KAF8338192.1 hypothetical protein EI90DRAFT_2991491 [Cantharellus anzutake]